MGPNYLDLICHSVATTSPYNDPQPADHNLPFFWTNTELPSYQSKNGFDLIFEDTPRRPIHSNGVWWRAELSVVGMDANGKYSPIQTITYGFEISNSKVIKYPIRTINPSAYHINSFR